ncbi:formate dehydrogenase accessory sulfurtransferase FdhD [Solemya velum gill symbiont]|uniref:formate dehydrogenase accessory sulfurtransferase FdhD n=1 Tax=Solemya velum gill symbiont TaxID=2340 RepID=UPI0009962AA6|nr:formate dehydrogenase accessory sulfurtransferase FdhD [Solemya velum gill symbiont]
MSGTAKAKPRHLPEMTNAGLRPAHDVVAVDEYGNQRAGQVAGERPLTLFLDDREIVTLMTLGTHPEMLTLGYLLNQRLVPCLESVDSIRVDWDKQAVTVETFERITDLDEKLKHRTVTSGCGQGTVFGRMGEQIEKLRVPQTDIYQSHIYKLLDYLNNYNEVYRQAGAVHGCALCGFGEQTDPFVDLFVEDVGRHNAADSISGHMWLNATRGEDKWFYTTGRLTSEMVIKVAQMGIPVVLSRSGVTQKGLELAQTIGVALISRAKGKHFLAYHGAERIQFDAIPPQRPHSDKTKQSSSKRDSERTQA